MPASTRDASPSDRALGWKNSAISFLVLGWFLLPLIAMAHPEFLPGSSDIGRGTGLATTLSFMGLYLSYGLAWLAMTIVGVVVAASAVNRRPVDNAE